MEYFPIMKKLLKTISQTFYEPHHSVIIDILLENQLLTDLEFCSKMKMLSREFNKLIIKLKEDRIIKQDIKIETKEDGRQSLKSVYFFNYGEIKDIIKYKIYRMTKRENRGNREMLYCPECERRISILDAQSSMEGYLFVCEHCRTELMEYYGDGDEVDVRGMMEVLEPVIEMLKETEKYEVPSFDYFQMLEFKGKIKELEIKEMEGREVEGKSKEVEMKENEAVEKVEEEKEEIEEREEIKMVEIKGKRKRVDEVTEEDIDEMNEEEYVKYFELCKE